MTTPTTPRTVTHGWDWRLWLWWALVSGFGTAAAMPLARIEAQLYQAVHGTSIYGAPLSFLDLAVPLGLPGGLIGLGWWLVLRTRFPLRGWTAACWVAGGFVLGFCPLFNFEDTGDIGGQALAAGVVAGIVGLVAGVVAGIVGLVAGAVQALGLSRSVPWAWWWVLITAVGCWLGWTLDIYVEGTALVRYVGEYNAGTAGYAVSGALIGLITAWLTARRLYPQAEQAMLPDVD